MVARKGALIHYRRWNRQHGAPLGRWGGRSRRLRPLLPDSLYLRCGGAFSVQSSNPTREFEYPWAFEVAQLRPRMRVLEVGGGLGGFQFVLDKAGCTVVNVDPGMAGLAWSCDQRSMRIMNRAFRTHVELRNCVIGEAGLEGGSYDRAFSISVLEHLSEQEARDVMDHVFACLRPGGFFVLTVDLFFGPCSVHAAVSKPVREEPRPVCAAGGDPFSPGRRAEGGALRLPGV